MKKKDDRVGNKEGKKESRGEKNQNRFAQKSPNLGFCACVKNKKAV